MRTYKAETSNKRRSESSTSLKNQNVTNKWSMRYPKQGEDLKNKSHTFTRTSKGIFQLFGAFPPLNLTKLFHFWVLPAPQYTLPG